MAGTSWVRLNGSAHRILRAMKDFNGRAKNLVRDTKEQVYVEVPDSELSWADKVAKDMGLSATVVPVPPEFETAPCGARSTNVEQHKLHCKTCYPLTHDGRRWEDRNTARPRVPASAVRVRATVPGLRGMDLNSVMAVMKQRLEECMTIAQNYEAAIKAIEGISDSDKRLAQIQQELSEHKKALKLFLSC